MASVEGRKIVVLLALVVTWCATPSVSAQTFGGFPDPLTNPLSGLMLDLPGTGTDPTAINYSALPVLSGDHEVVSQGDATWQFRLHNYITFYDNKYWLMWSHGPMIEDKATQHVRYVTSPDGVHWSPEENVVGPADEAGFRYIARGFWQRDGELYALASYDEAGGYFGDSLELRAYRWDGSEQRWDYAGVMADDTINNFEPKQLPSGQWMMSRRGNDYATDPADRTWLVGGVTSISDWQSSPIPVAANNARLEEPDFYELPDGNLVSLYRDNSGSKRLYRSFSTDQGQTWSQPVPTNFPDATAKFYDLKTSHGYYVLVSNANPASRNPLTLSISQDGLVYTQMAVLDIPGSGTFQYPHVYEHDGNLMVAFSRSKTSIETISVPLSSIDSILDYVPQPPTYTGLVNGNFETLSGTFPTGWSINQGSPKQHAGLEGSTTATLLRKQTLGGDRITQTLTASPGSKWELDMLFAMDDPGDASTRGFNIIVNDTAGGGNLNLRINGDGSVQTVTSSPTTTWFDVPNLAHAVQFSVDGNSDGDFSDPQDVLNVYRLVLDGDYSTASPNYTVSLSLANQIALALSGIANRWFGGSPTEGSSISSVSISAQNSGGSFVVDQAFLRSLVAGAPGDYNSDGVVDVADYIVWRDTLGSTTELDADGDGGGQVNGHDYDLWRHNFGSPHSGTAVGAATAPEPSTLAALMVGVCMVVLGKQVKHRGNLYSRVGLKHSNPDGSNEMTLRDKAYQHIHKRILTGQLRPGDVISEAALASEIGISRTPVREAIKHLQAAGLVDQVPRYGTIVRQPEYRDIIELFQLRAALESFALAASERNISNDAYRSGLAFCRQVLDIGREMMQDGSTAMDIDQLNRFLTADMAFHMVFLNAAGNQRIVKLVTDARAQIRSCGAGRPNHSLQTIVRAYRYHRRILRAARKGDVTQAQYWMRDHLRDSLQATLSHFLQLDPSHGSDTYFSLFQRPSNQ